MIVRDAIGRDKYTRAIIAVMAMDEYFLPRLIAHERQKLHELRIGGRRPSADWNANEAHALRFHFFAFPIEFGHEGSAKINDSSDAEFFQLGEAVCMRLCAAKEHIGNFSGVGDTRYVQSFAESVVGNGFWRRGRLGQTGSRSERKCPEKKCCDQRAAHKKLDAKSLARGRRVDRNETGLPIWKEHH